jgi:autotransporter-associated beta strand protein
MNAITRNAGSTVNFGAVSIATTDTSIVNGILGGYATVGATTGAADWAVSATSANDTAITANFIYPIFSMSSTNTNNESLTGSSALTGSATTNSLKIGTNTTGQSLNLGGLMFIGANDYQINNGTLKSSTATNSDLIVQQWGAGTLTINSVIATGNGTSTLTKAGTGTLALGGTNTYTGTTYVTAGTLLVNNTTGSGTGTGAVNVTNTGTILGGTGTISGATRSTADRSLPERTLTRWEH